MEELPNNKFKLEDFFDVEVVDMVHKKGGNIYTVHIPTYHYMVRDLDPDNVIITLGLDDGQGSLKVNIALLYFFGIYFILLFDFSLAKATIQSPMSIH